MTRVLAWICLALVAFTTACGLQLAVAAMVPPAASTPQFNSAISIRKVLIVALDPVTGERTQMECDALSSSFANDVVVVTAHDFPTVTQACVRG
jgi:hypothetical protein